MFSLQAPVAGFPQNTLKRAREEEQTEVGIGSTLGFTEHRNVRSTFPIPIH